MQPTLGLLAGCIQAVVAPKVHTKQNVALMGVVSPLRRAASIKTKTRTRRSIKRCPVGSFDVDSIIMCCSKGE